MGIETVDFQTRLVSGFSDDLQVKWLESELGMRSAVDEIERALVPARNVHMADVAEEFLRGSAPAFIAVGSAHAGGDDGIVHLLEQGGYQAEEVPLARQAAKY